jgi:DUF4097 and DUF4098 domain-containing protein YvlB
MFRIALFSLTAVLLSAQDSLQLTREGPYYVRTSTARVTERVPAQLHIVTRANVVLRGGKGEQVLWRLVRRVKARSEAEAEHLLGSESIVISPRANLLTLTVTLPALAQVANDLEVSVPHQVVLASVISQGGSVEAYDVDGSVQINAAMGIHCDRIRGNINGQTAGGEIRLGKISGSAVCISGGGSIFIESLGGGARCETAGGEIVVKDAGGPLLLSNVSGNIEVDHAASTVEAHTGEGVIEVNQAGGEVIADTRGGSIQIGSARGARCESAAGAIRVKNASGPLNVQTVMGSILAELIAGARLEDSLLSASAGDVTVLIPSKLALSVMARNDSGTNPRILSDFLEVPVKSFGFSHPPTLAQGQINGGGPILRINVGAGIIYLKKLKQ